MTVSTLFQFGYALVPEAGGLAFPAVLQKLDRGLVFRRGEKRYAIFVLCDERKTKADLDKFLVVLDVYKNGVHVKRYAGWKFRKRKGRLELFDLSDLDVGKYECILRITRSWAGQVYEKYLTLEIKPTAFEYSLSKALPFSFEVRVSRDFGFEYHLGDFDFACRVVKELSFVYTQGGRVRVDFAASYSICVSTDFTLAYSSAGVATAELKTVHALNNLTNANLPVTYRLGEAVSNCLTVEYHLGSVRSSSLHYTYLISNESRLYLQAYREAVSIRPNVVTLDLGEQRLIKFEIRNASRALTPKHAQAIVFPSRYIIKDDEISKGRGFLELFLKPEMLKLGLNILEIRVFDRTREWRVQSKVYHMPLPKLGARTNL